MRSFGYLYLYVPAVLGRVHPIFGINSIDNSMSNPSVSPSTKHAGTEQEIKLCQRYAFVAADIVRRSHVEKEVGVDILHQDLGGRCEVDWFSLSFFAYLSYSPVSKSAIEHLNQCNVPLGQ